MSSASMDEYWIPSIAESALFGTKIADDVYQVNIGGDSSTVSIKQLES